jgi:hypothetical protein
MHTTPTVAAPHKVMCNTMWSDVSREHCTVSTEGKDSSSCIHIYTCSQHPFIRLQLKIYLTTVSTVHTVVFGTSVNNELETTWKKVVVARTSPDGLYLI